MKKDDLYLQIERLEYSIFMIDLMIEMSIKLQDNDLQRYLLRKMDCEKQAKSLLEDKYYG